MLPSKYGHGQQSSIRKSKLDARPSMLPKPRRPGSTDRLSTEARRPSAVGQRSSSADPPRATFGAPAGRLSREASATKLQYNGRSRSQSAMTPLKTSQYPGRATTTPQRTPSEDRTNRSWQASLDRVLAFVTVKDQRPISNVAWQRAEFGRVQAALASRGGIGGGGIALIRPLTIARFVDIAGALVSAISPNVKLNNDNYVTKLPHVGKRFLYPGTLSKSWLKTVNTLHAFPQALALIAYCLDLLNHIESPVDEETLYVGRDELSKLRRDHLSKCWVRFQFPDCSYEDLEEEYREQLTRLLGNDDDKIAELTQQIKHYESCLNDPAQQAAISEETRLRERRDTLTQALRAAKAARCKLRTEYDAQTQLYHDHCNMVKELDAEIERTVLQSQQVQLELECQTMSISERSKLLEEVEFAVRVTDSKRAVVEQISKMVLKKETELALWQNRTLESCVEYKQGLIHLSAHFPHLAELHIDEKDLMSPECAVRVSSAVTVLRECSASLSDARSLLLRNKIAGDRKRIMLIDESRKKISELKASIKQERVALTADSEQLSTAASQWIADLKEINAKIESLNAQQHEYKKIDQELEYWENVEQTWRKKIKTMQDYIKSQRAESERLLPAAISKRLSLITDKITHLSEKLAM